MSTYAQLSDVESDVGAPIPAEAAHLVQQLLDEAEIQLAAYVGDLDERVAAELTTADRVTSAVVGMVTRVLRTGMAFDCYLIPEQDAATALRCLAVTRRERFLVGVSAAAGALSLADADLTLATPTVPVRPRQYGPRSWR